MRDEAIFLIRDELIEIKEHFNDPIDGGWDLDLDFIRIVVSERLLGFDLSDLIIQEVLNEGLNVELRNKEIVIRSEEPYRPVYYDDLTNEIIVIEDSTDKSYLAKYSSYNNSRYAFLGKL